MTVTNVSSTPTPYSKTVQSPWQQQAKDFQALQSALQSGNLSDAQTAFASLQPDMGNSSQDTSTQPSNAASSSALSSGQTDPLTSAFQALGSALSGNLSAAQSAFATIEQDMQNSGAPQGTHHRHHHRPSSDSDGSTSRTTPAPHPPRPPASVRFWMLKPDGLW
jgi:hypothetical protein